jgi:DNA-binding MarR family transcriptional regulator
MPAPLDTAPRFAQEGTVSHTIFRLARAHRMLASHLLREVGLRPGQELLMMQLWQAGPMRQNALAALFDTDSASMTRTVQRLERAGYVRRVPDPTDGRATLVEPTPASQGLRTKVEQIWQELERLTLGAPRPSEAAASKASLTRLEANVAEALRNMSAGQQPR